MNIKKAIAFTLAIGAPSYAIAYDYSIGDVDMSLHGFGTLGWTQTDNNDVGFAPSSVPGNFPGVDSSGTFDSDTSFALQGRVAYDRFSVTLQAVSRGEQDYNPKIEWFYGAIEIMDGLTVRGGRLRLPVYMLSESLEVGYSYNWVRPPIEVYNQVLLTNYEGGDITYTNSLYDYDYSLQAYYGTRNVDGHTHLKLKDIIGVNGTIGNEYITLRAGYANARLSVENPGLDPLLNGLRNPAIQGFLPGESIANDLDTKGENADFYGVGFSMDYEDFLLSGEYTWLRVAGVTANSEGWYISTGYRIGAFTPTFTFSSYRQTDHDALDNAIAGTAATSGFLPFNNALVGGVLPGQSNEQESITVGLRYDIDTANYSSVPTMAIKAEWQYINPKGTHGMFVDDARLRSNAGNFSGSGVSVFSVALDFVF